MQPLPTAGSVIAKEEKLHFPISAEVFAILIRALRENNVVTNKYKTKCKNIWSIMSAPNKQKP